MARILATGDLHVGAGASMGDRLADHADVLDRILELALEQDCDTLLIAGDVWHRRRPSPAETMVVLRFVARAVDELDLDVVVIAGNHDRESSRAGLAIELLTYAGAHVFTRPACFKLDDRSGLDPPASLAIVPWAHPGEVFAALLADRDESLERVAELVTQVAAATVAQAGAGAILVTHYSISGATASSGAPVDLFREPVLPVESLMGLGARALVAGHIHKPQTLGDDRAFYVGSPMPLDFGEAAHAHGAYVLDTAPGTAEATFHPLESRELVTVDVAPGDVDARWPVGSLVRVRITGTREGLAQHTPAESRRTHLDAGAAYVQVETTVTDGPRARVELDTDIDDTELLAEWWRARDEGDAPLPAQLASRHRDIIGEAT